MKLVSSLGELTTVSKASSKFESLRTTVPRSVVKQWKIIEGDRLDWSWDVVNGQMVLLIRKESGSGNQSAINTVTKKGRGKK